MFEPKIYKSNNLEAYHLITEDGGSFLYEGKVEYSEDQIFKDEQGKAYYRVTTGIGGDSTYYVEVEPRGTPIPQAQKKDKTISELIMASPRDEPIDKKPEPPAETSAIEPAVPSTPPDNCFESPEKPATPETTAPKPSVTEEAQAAVKAMASLPDHKQKKKRSLLLPVIGALLIIIIIASAGVYVYKPDVVATIKHHLITNATPTPQPTATPTPAPTMTPTATPNPTPSIPDGTDLLNSLSQIVPAIDSNNSTVVAFANDHDHTSVAEGSDLTIAKACDLYEYVNAHWVMANGTSAPQNAVLSVTTLKGDDRDYSILIASLMGTLGYDSRVVAAYNDTIINYYPQVDIKNEDGWHGAQSYLHGRYNITDPYFYTKGSDHWLSMAMGNTVGLNVNASSQYTIDSINGVTKL